MKTIKYTAIFLLVFFFLYIIYRTGDPIKPAPLNINYHICAIPNPTIWQYTRLFPSRVVPEYGLVTSDNYIEFTFINLDKTPYTPLIECRGEISQYILYRAHNLKALISVNQPLDIFLSIYRKGWGPGGQPIHIGSEDTNKTVLLTQDLDVVERKLNWISGDYETAAFGLSNYDPSFELKFRVYQVYLE
ncbi:MAG: hypothetical protein Q8P92_01890 [Candidatus Daviesbacteria bacterium]|nr:hypothetical protein [Candidatus Daviesbacteria bacterium]